MDSQIGSLIGVGRKHRFRAAFHRKRICLPAGFSKNHRVCGEHLVQHRMIGSQSPFGNQEGLADWSFRCAARWRRDGEELFYVHPLGKMMSVELKSRDTLEPGPPRILFKFCGSNNPYGTFRYDVTADGRKFLILTPDEDISFDPLHVVLNWNAGLKHQY